MTSNVLLLFSVSLGSRLLLLPWLLTQLCLLHADLFLVFWDGFPVTCQSVHCS